MLFAVAVMHAWTSKLANGNDPALLKKNSRKLLFYKGGRLIEELGCCAGLLLWSTMARSGTKEKCAR
jgi:hypothetical protein